MSWSLQALNPELNAETIAITNNTVVGRQQDADLVIQAAGVSRRHAQLQLQNGALWVQDLNSANGTFVNDLRIEATTALHADDILQFASFKFKVLAATKNDGEAPVAAALTDGMPVLTERDQTVSVGGDGMPQRVAVPKPAPIPADAIANIKPQSQPQIQPIQTPSDLAQRAAQDRNAKIGLWALFVLLLIGFIVGSYLL